MLNARNFLLAIAASFLPAICSRSKSTSFGVFLSGNATARCQSWECVLIICKGMCESVAINWHIKLR